MKRHKLPTQHVPGRPSVYTSSRGVKWKLLVYSLTPSCVKMSVLRCLFFSSYIGSNHDMSGTFKTSSRSPKRIPQRSIHLVKTARGCEKKGLCQIHCWKIIPLSLLTPWGHFPWVVELDPDSTAGSHFFGPKMSCWICIWGGFQTTIGPKLLRYISTP